MEPDDAPWLNLSPEEIQQLRTNKQHLTEYGKQKIRELMNHEEMLEIAAEREAANEAIIAKVSEEDYQKVMDAAKENKVLDIAKKFMEENSEAMEKLAAIEKKDLIDYALEELNAIVMGGQDTREFYNSVSLTVKI